MNFADRKNGEKSLVALLGRPDTPTDGVADYCTFLAKAVEARGFQMSLAPVRWMVDGWFNGLRRLWHESAEWRGQWVLLQYTALGWSRRGFPLGAVVTLVILRRRGVRCAVVFHEPYRQIEHSPRWIDRIRGACQDWTVRAMYRRTEKAVFADPLETIAWLPKNRTKAAYIPIGANIPEALPRSNNDGNRQREVNDISQAMNLAAANGIRLRVVFLGRGTAEAKEDIGHAFQKSSVEVLNLGLRSAEQISRVLSESDAMLCVRGKLFPRRGSALAGIACGVPIIAYAGLAELTPLAEAGIELVPYGDSIALGGALARTLTARDRWQEFHQKNLEVPEKYFSWNSIATKLIDALDIRSSSP